MAEIYENAWRKFHLTLVSLMSTVVWWQINPVVNFSHKYQSIPAKSGLTNPSHVLPHLIRAVFSPSLHLHHPPFAWWMVVPNAHLQEAKCVSQILNRQAMSRWSPPCHTPPFKAPVITVKGNNKRSVDTYFSVGTLKQAQSTSFYSVSAILQQCLALFINRFCFFLLQIVHK